MARTVSWTVIQNGEVITAQVGEAFDKEFPSLLTGVVAGMLDTDVNAHGVLQQFADGSQILTVCSGPTS